MKAINLKQKDRAPFLKVVNNSLGNKNMMNETINRIYINTLTPCFNYINKAGEVVTPQCALL